MGRLRGVTERTLVLVKPDGVGRKLIGEVLARIERKGLDVVALELRTVDRDLATQHYAEHDGKPFFESLLEFITSGPVLAAKQLIAEGRLGDIYFGKAIFIRSRGIPKGLGGWFTEKARAGGGGNRPSAPGRYGSTATTAEVGTRP